MLHDEGSKPHLLMITEVSQAIAYLRERQLPLSITEAIGVLREAAQEDRFLALYHHSFPQEFAASTAPLLRAPGQAYSQREAEFFRLVDRKLFPIPYLTDWALEELDAEERSPYLPVTPWGRDWYDEYDLEPGWQVLLVLAGEISLNEVTPYAFTLCREPTWPQIEELLTQALALIEPREHLERVAALAEEPVCHLPLALQFIRHSTDNLFLDSTPEMGVEQVPWCVENIDLLTRECQQAEEIMDRITSLVSWLEADLVSHLREVVELWQQNPVQV